MGRVNNQDGIVFDALSAGPIEGLVDGSKSIYLNGAPFTKLTSVDQTQIGTLSFKTNKVLKGNDFVDVKNSEIAPLIGADFAVNEYFIWIEGAGQTFVSDNYINTGGRGYRRSYLKVGDVPRKYCYDLTKLNETEQDMHQNATSPILQTFVLNETNERGYFSAIYSTEYTGGGHSPGIEVDTYDLAHDFYGTKFKTEGLKNYSGSNIELTNTKKNLTQQFDYVAKITGVTDLGTGNSRITFDTGSSSSPKPETISRTVSNAETRIVLGSASPQNFLGDSEFRTGERNQDPMKIGENEAPATTSVQVQPNVSLEWSKLTGGTAGPTIVNSSGTTGYTLGLQPNQFKNINSVVCAFTFPQGHFIQDKDGDLEKVLTELQVTLFYRNSPTENYKSAQLLGRKRLVREAANRGAADRIRTRGWDTPVENEWLTRGTKAYGSDIGDTPSDEWKFKKVDADRPDGNNEYSIYVYTHDDNHFTHEEKGNILGFHDFMKRQLASREVVLDLSPYDFNEFYLEFQNLTPVTKEDYFNAMSTGNDHFKYSSVSKACVLSLIQVEYKDTFTYPLTAYGAVKFSGSDFDTPPTRGYHCRGMKVKVPSNYNTREEDAKAGGLGVANYNRKVEYDSSSDTYSVKKTNILNTSITIGMKEDSYGTTKALDQVGFEVGMTTPGIGPRGAGNTWQNTPDIPFTIFFGVHNDDSHTVPAGSSQAYYLITHINHVINGVDYSTVNQDVPENGALPTVNFNLIESIEITIDGTSTTLLGIDKVSSAGTLQQTTYASGGFTQYAWSTGGTGDPIFLKEHVGKVASIKITYTQNVFGVYERWGGSFRGDVDLSPTNPNYGKVYTNNPAWIYYDILTNKDYGLGDYISESDVDKFELYQIGRYCDELVSDGKGGLEPRFTCNVYITKYQEAYKLLKDLASVFRGMVLYMEGLITAVQDRPKESVYLFNQTNVIDGNFSYQYTGSKARPNSIGVTWNDPKQLYKQDTLVVDDHVNITQEGKIIEKNVVAFGCTSEAQARRVGAWHLATDLQETEIVSFKTSINAGHLRVGDIISIQDQELNERIVASGRIVDSNGLYFKLDRHIDPSKLSDVASDTLIHIIIPEAGAYLTQNSATINGIEYRRGDLILTDNQGTLLSELGELEEVILNNILDDDNNLISVQLEERGTVVKRVVQFDSNAEKVDEFFVDTPIVLSSKNASNPTFYREKVFAITSAKSPQEDAILKKYRILSMAEDNVTEYTITAGLYSEEKFDEIDKDYSVYTDPLYDGALIDTSITPVTDAFIGLEPDYTSAQGTPAAIGGFDLVIDWATPFRSVTDSLGNTVSITDGMIGGYVVQHNAGAGGTQVIETVKIIGVHNSFIKIPNVADGTYTITIKTFSIGDDSKLSAPFTITKTVAAPVGSVKISRVGLGGNINKSVNFSKSTGLFTVLSASDYIFTNLASEETFGPTTVSTTTSQQSFSSMTNSTTAYLLFNYGGVGQVELSTSADPWKPVYIHTDSTATNGDTLEAPGFTYLKEVGASNNGLSALSSGGTLTLSNVEVQLLNRVLVTFTTDHGLKTGDSITITGVGSGSTVQLNSQTYLVSVASPTTVTLLDDINTFTNGGGFAVYDSTAAAGTATRSSTVTVTGTEGSNIIVGKNTSFTTDCYENDIIKLSTAAIGTEVATSEYLIIQEVIDNHTLKTTTNLTRTYGAEGAVLTVDNIHNVGNTGSALDANRVAATYSNVRPTTLQRGGVPYTVDSATGAWGSGLITGVVGTFKVVIAANGTVSAITPENLGSGFAVDDVLVILDTDVGGTGAADNIEFDVATISSSAFAYKPAIRVSPTSDCIFAEVTKDSSAQYAIEFFGTHKGLGTSSGEDVNQTNFASKQNVFVETNTQTSTREQTIVSSTINTPAQAANRTINAKSDSIGKIGFRGPQVAVSGVDLSTDPIIVTTGAAHGLTDFCKATFSGFTDTKELNGRQYFVKRGDASDANLTTKFRLFDTLNTGVVANVTLSSGGAGMNASTTVNAVNTTSNGTGSGLTLDVTTNGSGVISGVAIRNGGTNYSEGEAITLVLDASPGNGLGSNSGTITIGVNPTTGVKFELADSVDGTSGFTSGGSFTNTKMQQINPCTLSLSASIDLESVSSTIANADIDSAIAKSFSSPYVPVAQSWIEWEFGYGGGHAHNTFSDLVSSKNLVVGATITQGSYTGAITYVQDNGSDAAIVNAEQDSDTVPNSTSDVTITFDGTSAITMNAGTAQTTLVDANNVFQDKSISVAGSTGSITTVGNSTVNLQGKTESPSIATISTISNVFEDDDIVIITETIHGFTTGTPISFSDVRVINGAAPSAIGSDITSTKNNGLGFNDGVTYFVHKTSERAFKVAKTQDGSDFVHGREFFTGDEEAINNLYFIATRSTVDHASFVHTNTASIINDVSLQTDAIT